MNLYTQSLQECRGILRPFDYLIVDVMPRAFDRNRGVLNRGLSVRIVDRDPSPLGLQYVFDLHQINQVLLEPNAFLFEFEFHNRGSPRNFHGI